MDFILARWSYPMVLRRRRRRLLQLVVRKRWWPILILWGLWVLGLLRRLVLGLLGLLVVDGLMRLLGLIAGRMMGLLRLLGR